MIERMRTNARMSQIVTFPLDGEMVILAGQVADDRSADAAGQTRDVLAKIDALLDAAGADKDSVVSANIWLKDMGDFDAMNAVWDDWVPDGKAPARACVEAALAFPELLVEIQVIAVKSR